jgi:hypothetical protein
MNCRVVAMTRACRPNIDKGLALTHGGEVLSGDHVPLAEAGPAIARRTYFGRIEYGND